MLPLHYGYTIWWLWLVSIQPPRLMRAVRIHLRHTTERLGYPTGIDPVLPLSQSRVQATTLRTPYRNTLPGVRFLLRRIRFVFATTPHNFVIMCFYMVKGLRLHPLQQHLWYYRTPCEHTFSRHPLKPLRYSSLLSASPFLKPGSRLVITCYSAPSFPLILRTIKPCELRTF